MLRERARLLAAIRRYFDAAGVLELTTPVLVEHATTEPTLANFCTEASAASPRRYLRTSPESALKQWLARGCGDVYELGPVFRAEEAGRVHLSEFTLLEWYRIGFDHHRLMDDVEALLGAVGFREPIARVTFADLWRRHFDDDPHTLPTGQLARIAAALPWRPGEADARDRAALFDAIYVQVLEPALAQERALFIHAYPVELRAYARLSDAAVPVAERFELIIGGLEIANGYHEIVDPDEQRRCFERENALRVARGRACAPPDEAWLAALASGLPRCAGVALGVERLHLALRRGAAIDTVAPGVPV